MFSNSNSFALASQAFTAPDDPVVRSLPWLFRVMVAGCDSCGQAL